MTLFDMLMIGIALGAILFAIAAPIALGVYRLFTRGVYVPLEPPADQLVEDPHREIL